MVNPGRQDIKSIDDKNKAGSFAKVLVCTQALWMVLQCTARVSSELPVTLLEGHTLEHVICALCMYVWWWDKPSDVRYPILLDLPEQLKRDIYYSTHCFDLRIEIRYLPEATEGDPNEKSTAADGTCPAASGSTDQRSASAGNSDIRQETGGPTTSPSNPVIAESTHRAVSDRQPLPGGLRYKKTEINQGSELSPDEDPSSDYFFIPQGGRIVDESKQVVISKKYPYTIKENFLCWRWNFLVRLCAEENTRSLAGWGNDSFSARSSYTGSVELEAIRRPVDIQRQMVIQEKTKDSGPKEPDESNEAEDLDGADCNDSLANPVARCVQSALSRWVRGYFGLRRPVGPARKGKSADSQEGPTESPGSTGTSRAAGAEWGTDDSASELELVTLAQLLEYPPPGYSAVSSPDSESKTYLKNASSNWTVEGSLSGRFLVWLNGIAMALLPAVYGTIHAVAWNIFPTNRTGIVEIQRHIYRRYNLSYSTIVQRDCACHHKRNNPGRRRSWPRLKWMAETMKTKTSEIKGWKLVRKVLLHIAWAFGGIVYLCFGL